MATDDEKSTSTAHEPEQVESAAAAVRAAAGAVEGEDVAFDAAAASLGAAKYVQAAFFAAGVLIAYLMGNVLGAVWNGLAEWPAAVRAVPQLLRLAEDERPSVTMPIGAVFGILAVLYAARKPGVREWADEVATELYKVHWPERETVTNGTIVVIVASAFATVYVGLLDRVWAFVTNLVYGV